jgi:hypothetical protein
MKKKNLLTAVLLLMAGTAMAQNALQVEDFTLPQNGGDIAMTLTLDEADKYVSYQFKIQTPVGVGYVADSDDDVECILGTGHDASHAATAHWNASDKLLTVGVASMKSALFKGTTLELQIPMAATTAAVGTEFGFTVKDIAFIDKEGVKSYLNDVTFKATIGDPVEQRTILNETSTKAPAAATGVNVRVKRTINANEWSTICLPFAMSAAQCKAAFGDDVQLANFTSWSSDEDGEGNIVAINVGFTSVTAIEANHPYIVKVLSAITDFTVDGVNIAPEDEPTVQVGTKKAERGYMIGTYVTNFTVPNEDLFLNGGKFWYSRGLTKMKAFRAYFEFADVLTSVEGAGAPAFNIIFGGGTTNIKDIKAEQNDDFYYNLGGQRVEAPAKGLYIKNGKKVVIK